VTTIDLDGIGDVPDPDRDAALRLQGAVTALDDSDVWRPVLDVWVPGKPAAQGSKRYLGPGRVVEQSKNVAPWRSDVRSVVASRWHAEPIAVAVRAWLDFVMPRPSSAPKRFTPNAVKRPDLDKLQRAILDALGSAGVWGDDSQVIDIRATKRLADPGETPGCNIRLDVAE
jgi:crossover junction endodeoxyribonuclease RusA